MGSDPDPGVDPGVDVVVTILCGFCQFSTKKWRFSQKQKGFDLSFAKLATV
jgi:hypothetical protein